MFRNISCSVEQKNFKYGNDTKAKKILEIDFCFP